MLSRQRAAWGTNLPPSEVPPRCFHCLLKLALKHQERGGAHKVRVRAECGEGAGKLEKGRRGGGILRNIPTVLSGPLVPRRFLRGKRPCTVTTATTMFKTKGPGPTFPADGKG